MSLVWIIVDVGLVAVILYGVVTHRRWLWISASVIVVVSFTVFVLLGGLAGHGGAGYFQQ